MRIHQLNLQPPKLESFDNSRLTPYYHFYTIVVRDRHESQKNAPNILKRVSYESCCTLVPSCYSADF